MLHLGALQYLILWSPTIYGTMGNWNQAVWPWNIALALTGFALIAPWQRTVREDWKDSAKWTRAVVAAMCVYPFGYYFGFVDAYLAHCLYSYNTPAAAILSHGEQNERVDQLIMLEPLNVPFPPVPRLYKVYFAKVAEPGDALEIIDRRYWAKLRGDERRVFIKVKDAQGARITPLPATLGGYKR